MRIFFFEEFGKAFVPRQIRPGLGKYLAKAGIDNVPYKFFGILFWITAIITYFMYVPGIYPVIKQKAMIVFFILTFVSWFFIQVLVAVIIVLGIYFYLNIQIYQRTKILEDMLPDYMALVSTNLKGGMNFEKALWTAIKPEFGILAKEVGLVSKRVATGNDVTEALQEFADKYNSPRLKRSIDLLKGEILSGGAISKVIDSLVANLKKTKALKQEMVAATLTYMIFMAAIVVFIMPALFALAKQLLQILLGFGERLSSSFQSGATSMFSFSVANIDPFHFQLFSIGAISIIAIFSSMIISTIEKGDIKGGLKYIPLFWVGSIVMYFIFSVVLEAMMG
ncbi:MAG: type II secretion system F family protein, partial [Nanoarchaeota archaeon]|nr:type II secretion system F family protein [Nanoarchaeota archaeon]MBU2442035.1 type II secretion system F family protein [Nanoarchaeota archaeon]